MNPRGGTPTGLAGRRPTRLGDPGIHGKADKLRAGINLLSGGLKVWSQVSRLPAGRLGLS